MRGFVSVFVLMCVWQISVSQTYLDTVYDFGINGFGIEVNNRGALKSLGQASYRTVIGSGSLQNLSWNLVLTDFDFLGELSNTIRIGDTTELFWPRDWIELENDTVVLLCRYDRPYDTALLGYQYCLMAFDITTGEIHWQQEYGEAERSDAPFGLNSTEDGGFVMTGASYSYAIHDNDVYTIKVDHFGNVEWESYVGGDDDDVGCSIYELDDGAFLIGGRSKSYGNGNYEYYLVRLDTDGNEVWHQTYDGGQPDACFGMTRTFDDNYVLHGGKDIQSGWLLKVDESGNEIWNQQILDFPYYEIYGVREVESNRLINYGICIDPDDGSDAGCASLTTSTGEVVWKRVYNRSSGIDYLTNGTATEDGGFLFLGQARNVGNGTSDAWILKVDSMGCPHPNCVTGIEENEMLVMVDVWPNPVSDVLNIELSPFVKQMEVTVHDLTGKQYLQRSIAQTRVEINVSELPAGIYILSGKDTEGRHFSLKFVSE